MAKTYQEQLLHPKWQRRKAEILTRDNFTCKCCGDKETTLHVHHIEYWGSRMAWEYPDELLVTLCQICHDKEKERVRLESQLVQSLKSNGFLVSDLMAMATKVFTDREFTETLLKTLRKFQNG